MRLNSNLEKRKFSLFRKMAQKTIGNLHIPPSANLDVSNNQLTSLEGLPYPEKIKSLQANNNNLAKIEENKLQRCKILSNLDLSNNKIPKIENLFNLHHLHVLNLSNNLIAVIENLEGNVNLKQLFLSGNKITSIFIRSPLPRLVLLDISGNNLRRLTGISVFPCLSTLIVENCILTTLHGLQKLLNLRRISAASNQIADFQPFSLPLLSHVDLRNNKITSFTSLMLFQSLVYLDLSGNPINDDGLGVNVQLPELKEFRANGSSISDPSIVSSIAPNVVSISLLFCQISKIENVQLLTKTAPQLVYLDLRCNPINSQLYPDLVDKHYGDVLPEYESEDAYDSQYPQSIDLRQKYRKTILSNSKNEIRYLDGIKIPTKNESPVLPPSQINFQFVDTQLNDQSESSFESSASVVEQSVQCDISCSVVSADESFLCDRGMQTERVKRPPNYQYPPSRKIFATDSTSEISNDESTMKYVDSPPKKNLDRDNSKPKKNLSNDNSKSQKNLNNGHSKSKLKYADEYESELKYADNHNEKYSNSDDSDYNCADDVQFSPPKEKFLSDYSLYDSLSSDSGPYDIDLNKIGVNAIQPKHSDDDMDDEFASISCATDADSEMFYPAGLATVGKKGCKCGSHISKPDYGQCDVENSKGGCAFWIDFDTAKKPFKQNRRSSPKSVQSEQPNEEFLYAKPRKTACHYPFNTKTPRRLPWDDGEDEY